jgi:hypothetical protein
MKTVTLAIVFIFISGIAFAQSKVSVLQLSKAPKAKLIGQSNFGKVYALSQDNMPCIVPPTATAALMPVIKIPLTQPAIPNAVPKQDLIAANGAANNFFKLNKATLQPSKNLMLDLVRKK